MNNIKIGKCNSNMIMIFKGLIFSVFITLLSIFIFSIILAYTNVPDEVIPIVILIITFFSILIGSMIGIRKISKNGMYNGSIIGGIYVILLYIISSIVNTCFVINTYTIFMIIAGMIAGIIGGIIGVNT